MTTAKDDLIPPFRERLAEVIERSGQSRAAFAAAIGLDRSTLSQLLSSENERLPRAETVVALAREAGVSTDWLLGLSQSAEIGTQVVANQLEIEGGAGDPLDKRLTRWHTEAVGSKIRYVPATLPDLLKTEATIDFEYQQLSPRVQEAQRERAEARLAYSRRPETDMEVCSSFQMIEAFARGEFIWRTMPVADRRAQLEQMAKLLDELYPTFRWFLYDGLQRFSVPVTIYGLQRAVLYIGGMFIVLQATEHIRVLSKHFDDLVRAATVQPPDVISLIEGLLRKSK
ncbi:helix-turn-helix domain-containing protein [Algihabitans albus]|uniref:helix-turn-helix domain-containing protein n=1 Tax=Algihabitans albus TaxID=2164067 RepID=UPI000E5CA055|nr:helix-turn-helix transcriptional regulator [Algihabitans albus]